MKVSIVVPVILAGVLALAGVFTAFHCKSHKLGAASIPAEVREAFQTWKQTYGKLYASPSEEAHRLANFHRAFVRVTRKNAVKSYRSALNKFSDLSKDEFKAKHTGLKFNKKAYLDYENSLLTKTPSNDVDWRTKTGVVTPIKDQGQCGSCWAFSATGALEGLAQISGGKSYSFSEQQLVDCSTKYGNDGCDGGLMNYAFQYVKDNGITTEDQYPYKAVDQSCKSKTGVYKVKGFKNVPAKSSPALASACDTQPVSVAIEADEIMDYDSGIFDDRSCGDQLDHGVLLVGYTATYWTVKNSWGTGWGEDGYIRFSRSAIPDKKGGICGILEAASYPTA